MFLKQYYLGCLAHASYMIADEETKIAAVVDPQRDVAQYIADAEQNGWSIRHVFLTHFHADFLAGHIELRDRCGAEIHLGIRGEAEYPVTAAHDGDVIEFGKVRLQILETPGHTPEGISILVNDLALSDTHPHAVLTGDTLFIGDVGRPDLLASIGVTADELADMLYDSLHNKLLPLPDDTLVYPAHGAGSMCGKNLSQETVSTMGEQKKFNYALQPMTREAFKTIVTEEQPEAPEYFVFDAIRNRQERPSLDSTLTQTLKPLTVSNVLQMQQDGAQLLDVRDAIDFEGAHLRGSLNIALRGKYATWCGTILGHDRPIVLIAEPGDETEAATRLGRIGFDNVAGYLAGGMQSLESRPDLLEAIDRITAAALQEQLDSESAPYIVDVRTAKEREAGQIAGSHHLSLNHLRERLDEIPANRTVVIHCEGGYRSAIAASLLAQAGRRNILDLVGGYKAWTTVGQPVAVTCCSQG